MPITACRMHPVPLRRPVSQLDGPCSQQLPLTAPTGGMLNIITAGRLYTACPLCPGQMVSGIGTIPAEKDHFGLAPSSAE